jgi:hypothetical protein
MLEGLIKFTRKDLMLAVDFYITAPKNRVPFAEEIANNLLEGIALGHTLEQLCAGEYGGNYPTKTAAYWWIESNKDFADRYHRAIEMRAHTRISTIQRLAQDTESGKLEPNAAKVAMSAYMWLAGKENSKYSDKVDVNITGKLNVNNLSVNELKEEMVNLLNTLNILPSLSSQKILENVEYDEKQEDSLGTVPLEER